MKIILALQLIFWVGSAYSAPIKGIASVIDGDTIEIHGQRIRLHGIDAPESRQLCRYLADGKQWRCGQAAAMALSDFIHHKNITCVQESKDRYGRVVAICYLKSTNLNGWLVVQGWALEDWPRYSKGRYKDYQKTAKANTKGIWSSEFDLPWKWRKKKR